MITITGYPVFDGMVEGFLAIPAWFAKVISPADLYAAGYWIGIILFVIIAGRLIFGWD